jgi:hypothetical protein
MLNFREAVDISNTDNEMEISVIRMGSSRGNLDAVGHTVGLTVLYMLWLDIGQLFRYMIFFRFLHNPKSYA